MYFEKAEIITKDDEDYVVLAIIVENDIEYAFVNKIDKEKDEVTEEYYVFMYNNNTIYTVTDEKTITRMMPKFQEGIMKNIEELGLMENN